MVFDILGFFSMLSASLVKEVSAFSVIVDVASVDSATELTALI